MECKERIYIIELIDLNGDTIFENADSKMSTKRNSLDISKLNHRINYGNKQNLNLYGVKYNKYK